MYKQKVSYLVLAATVVFIVIFSAPKIDSATRTYEVRPEIHSIPEQKSDVVRIVEAYERLMERYLSIVDSDLSGAVTTIEKIDNKIDQLDLRLRRIEQALGIESPKSRIEVDIINKKQELNQAVPKP